MFRPSALPMLQGLFQYGSKHEKAQKGQACDFKTAGLEVSGKSIHLLAQPRCGL